MNHWPICITFWTHHTKDYEKFIVYSCCGRCAEILWLPLLRRTKRRRRSTLATRQRQCCRRFTSSVATATRFPLKSRYPLPRTSLFFRFGKQYILNMELEWLVSGLLSYSLTSWLPHFRSFTELRTRTCRFSRKLRDFRELTFPPW